MLTQSRASPYRATRESHMLLSFAGVEGATGSNRGRSNDEGSTTDDNCKCVNNTSRGLAA